MHDRYKFTAGGREPWQIDTMPCHLVPPWGHGDAVPTWGCQKCKKIRFIMVLNYRPATSYQFALPLIYNTFCDISRRYYVQLRIPVIDKKWRKEEMCRHNHNSRPSLPIGLPCIATPSRPHPGHVRPCPAKPSRPHPDRSWPRPSYA
jgi:hypothetical protein